jgi:hypothetical protein
MSLNKVLFYIDVSGSCRLEDFRRKISRDICSCRPPIPNLVEILRYRSWNSWADRQIGLRKDPFTLCAHCKEHTKFMFRLKMFRFALLKKHVFLGLQDITFYFEVFKPKFLIAYLAFIHNPAISS